MSHCPLPGCIGIGMPFGIAPGGIPGMGIGSIWSGTIIGAWPIDSGLPPPWPPGLCPCPCGGMGIDGDGGIDGAIGIGIGGA